MTTVIRTERLELVPLRVEHADEMAVVLADPALYAFIGGEPDSARVLRARYARLVAGSPDPDVVWCNWVIRLGGPLVGTVQATVAGDRADIAWVVGVAWQGRGIATEAAKGMVGWLADRGIRSVSAYIHPDHTASAAVATAAGLRPTDEQHDGETRWLLDLR